MGLLKRNKQFDGLDCVLDAAKPEYMAAKKVLQSQVSYNFQMTFANYTVYFCVSTVFLFTMKRVWYHLQGYLYKRRRRKIMGSSLVDVFAAYCRSIGYSQIKLEVAKFTFLDISGGQLIFFLVSWLYLLCICCVPHAWYRACVGFGLPPLALRAGALSIALVPFIFVLSGKCNVISLLTGIGYEKLNVVHRYTAAAAFIFSMVHVISFLYQNLNDGGYLELHLQFKDPAYYSGIPTFITFAILCLLFTSPLRKYFYELFLHIHWIMAMAFYGTLFWHVFGTPLVSKYLYATIALWFSQLVFRLFYLLINRKGNFALRPKEFEMTKLGESAMLLTIKNTEGWSWKPGQHCFIRFLSNRMLDNHPFSISSYADGNLKFYIVPKRGLTKDIFDKVEKQGSYKGWCLVDGPYGGALRDFSSFDCLTLIATGSGATATLPFLSAISDVLTNFGETDQKVVASRVNFIWIVRRSSDLSWAMPELQRCLSVAGNFVKITIYISQGTSFSDYSLKEKVNALQFLSGDGLNITEALQDKIPEKFSQEKSLTSYPNDDISYGDVALFSFKPRIDEIIWDLLPTLERRNMFIACGNPSMMRVVGNAVAKMQSLVFNCTSLKNMEELYLHTERFGW